MVDFEDGYEFFAQRAGVHFAGYKAEEYVDRVKSEIDKLASDLNDFKGFKTDPKILKGNIAEFWHSDSFNVNAVARGSSLFTSVAQSNKFASVDINSDFGENFSLKYYDNGQGSAKQQAKSVFEYFREYQSKGGKETLEEFLRERDYLDDTVLNDPIYTGQVRIIPKEQLEEAYEWLRKKIATESVKRPEQVARYQETLKMLSDRIRDGRGTESVTLSKKDAEMLAVLAKEGNVTLDDLAKLGVSTEDVIKFEYIAKQAFKSGLSAATISIVLKVAPEIYSAIEYLIKNGDCEKISVKS